jgi:hypothetical protein
LKRKSSLGKYGMEKSLKPIFLPAGIVDRQAPLPAPIRVLFPIFSNLMYIFIKNRRLSL